MQHTHAARTPAMSAMAHAAAGGLPADVAQKFSANRAFKEFVKARELEKGHTAKVWGYRQHSAGGSGVHLRCADFLIKEKTYQQAISDELALKHPAWTKGAIKDETDRIHKQHPYHLSQACKDAKACPFYVSASRPGTRKKGGKAENTEVRACSPTSAAPRPPPVLGHAPPCF